MSGVPQAIEAAMLALGVGATIVAVAGIAFAKDAFAQLIYGSIPAGAALVAIAIAVAIGQGPGISATQAIMLVLLSVPSSAIAGHRIAAVVHERNARDDEGDESGNEASAG